MCPIVTVGGEAIAACEDTETKINPTSGEIRKANIDILLVMVSADHTVRIPYDFF